MGERIGLLDEEWTIIGTLLPPETGRGCRPARGNRLYFDSVFRRYRRWVMTGVFDAMLETLAEMVERDATADMIDGTVVRAHGGFEKPWLTALSPAFRFLAG